MHIYIFDTYEERKYLHKEIFPDFKNDPLTFLKYVNSYKWRRPVWGLVHIRNNKDIVAVITKEGVVHIPAGKRSFNDNSNKMTAVREYFEECNYLLSIKELTNF